MGGGWATLFLFLHFLAFCYSSSSVRSSSSRFCSMWQFNVEVGNLRGWKVVPSQCEDYVLKYMYSNRYDADCQGTAMAAIDYARNYTLIKNGHDVWVFDVDETTLSNLAYYAQNHFGATPFNSTKFNEWVEIGKAPAIASTLKLYNELLRLGFKVFFLTGRDEEFRSITTKNLNQAGYSQWSDLLLRQQNNQGMTAVAYKSSKRKELEDRGYQIVGNVGDQWSDLTGYSTGTRYFKLPNPMYYIS